MKKHITWYIASLGLLVLWVLVLPINNALAQSCDNSFWSPCYVSGVNVIHTDDETVSSGLLDTIKNAINWILWILATVALCICMYGWFKMLTSWWDSKWFDAWKTVLKNAALWLAIILLSWMIVSVVFRFVWTLSWWNQTQGSWVHPNWSEPIEIQDYKKSTK